MGTGTSKPQPNKDPKYVGYGREQYIQSLSSHRNNQKRPKDIRKKVKGGKIVIGEPIKDSFVHLDHGSKDEASRISPSTGAVKIN